jgi:hypothetical protein
MHSERALAGVSGAAAPRVSWAWRKRMFLCGIILALRAPRKDLGGQNIFDLTVADRRNQQIYPQPVKEPVFPFGASHLGEFFELRRSNVQ